MSPCQMGSGLLEEDMAVTSFLAINKSPSPMWLDGLFCIRSR
jgi:hypothetical protein